MSTPGRAATRRPPRCSCGAETVLDSVSVAEILTRRAYRPGWELSAYEGQTRRAPIVRIYAVVPDSYHPDGSTVLDVYSPVPDPALESELEFDKWLLWRLAEIERHECYEWYRRPRVSGGWRPVINPHSEGADRDVFPVVERPVFVPPPTRP